MPTKQQTGSKGAVLVGGRDVTKHVKNYSSNITLGVDDCTHLQPDGDAVTYAAALQGGAAQLAGMLPVPRSMAEPELQAALGVQRDAEEFVCMPWGQTVGYYSEFFQVIQNRLQVQGMTANISTFSADYQATGGVKAGPVLLASQGTDTITVNAKFTITASSATGNVTVTFYNDTGKAVGTVTITPGMSTAAIEAAIEALNYYVNVTVTGSTNVITTAGNIALSSGGASATASSTTTITPADPNYALDTDPPASNGGWQSNQLQTMPQWFAIDAGTAKPIKSYEFTYTTDSAPKSWTLKGSNTGVFGGEETLIQTKTNIAFASAQNTVIPVTPTAAFRYYRFDFTAAQKDDGTSSDIVGFQQVILNAADTSSGTYTVEVVDPVAALTAPSTGSSNWATALTQSGANIVNAHLISAASAQTAVNNGASSNDGGYTQLNCTYASDDCNAIVRVRHADDSAGSPGTWSTLASFAAVTGEGSQFLEIPRGTTIKQWTRVEVLTGDITGEFAASVVLDRNPTVA